MAIKLFRPSSRSFALLADPGVLFNKALRVSADQVILPDPVNHAVLMLSITIIKSAFLQSAQAAIRREAAECPDDAVVWTLSPKEIFALVECM
jgi:hypothetical protein